MPSFAGLIIGLISIVLLVLICKYSESFSDGNIGSSEKEKQDEL